MIFLKRIDEVCLCISESIIHRCTRGICYKCIASCQRNLKVTWVFWKVLLLPLKKTFKPKVTTDISFCISQDGAFIICYYDYCLFLRTWVHDAGGIKSTFFADNPKDTQSKIFEFMKVWSTIIQTFKKYYETETRGLLDQRYTAY